MPKAKIKGSTLLCSTLERLGVDCVFGLPGSQNAPLYEGLRRSSIRTIQATHELAATFMANGYARVSGKVGVVISIPGPGFTYALTGLAEAFLDSAPVICLVGAPTKAPGNRFQLQAIDQHTMASPIVKKSFRVESISFLPTILAEAYCVALEDEPGPVLVEIESSVFSKSAEDSISDCAICKPVKRGPDPTHLQQTIQILKSSSRVVIYAGQGASDATDQLRKLAEILGAPVMTTTSGRGVIPEDHPLSFLFDPGTGNVEVINRLLRSCDLVMALGCKFSYNGAHGFRLCIPSDKLIHVDASPNVPGANYPFRIKLTSDVGLFLDAVLEHTEILEGWNTGWSPEELQQWRKQIRHEHLMNRPEPRLSRVHPSTPAAFFETLRFVLPVRSCLVTDSGLHQMLARRYFTVLAPRGLMVPSDFQSMGFGIPAAIGAKLGAPESKVVVVVGDGGMAISGMELITAVREKIPLTVILFNDGQLNLVRLNQLNAYGRSCATTLKNPDFHLFAKSIGADFIKLGGELEEVLRRCLNKQSITLLEVELEDSPEIKRMQARGLVKGMIRNLLSTETIGKIKRWKSRSPSV